MRVRKDGSFGSLFIRKSRKYKKDTWYPAQAYRTKGYAMRPGWHALQQPCAPHLKSGGDRVWMVVKIKDYEIVERPESQGGKWFIAKYLKILKPYDGVMK